MKLTTASLLILAAAPVVYSQDDGIGITNAHSGRRLYAQSNKWWESGVGAGHGTFWADQKWHFVESSCPTYGDIVTIDDTCYEITNAHSGRRLYAQSGREWESGVGAGLGTVYDDQKWILQEDDCGVDERCFLIVNAVSGRRLYAQAGRSWESGVGAGVGTVYDDQKWFILPGELVEPCLDLEALDLGEDCTADAIETKLLFEMDAAGCDHSLEEEVKALVQERDYGEAMLELVNTCSGIERCMDGWYDLTIEGCTYQKILNKVEQNIPGCPHDAATELQYWTSTSTVQGAKDAIADMCGAGWDVLSETTFANINPEWDDDFMNEYVNGKTYLNTETGSFQDTDDGNAISSFRGNEAASTVMQSVPDLEGCALQSIMCCFGRDRQPNDNNGNCAEPLDSSCVNADPADNTNLCFLSEEFGHEPVFPGETEGDIHCHGLAWAEDENDFTAQLKYNNFFFVSLFDHMYQRGYVESTIDSPDIPMCACIEDMQPVSRSDCTQIDATLKFTITLEDGVLTAMPLEDDELKIEFNSCQGTNPSNGNNQNNDLASYVHRLHNRGKLSADTQDAIFDILVGYNQPGNNNNEAACAAAYEDVTGQDYPQGIAITNAHSGRKLYSNNDIGASNSAELEDNQKWYLVPSSCDGGAYAPVGGDCLELLNAQSNRRAFAQANKYWEGGVGVYDGYVYPDQKWFLEEADYNGEQAYFIVNAYSGRRLYAQADKAGTSGVGAGVGTKYDDQKWFIKLERNYEELL